jgi:hypothetical protein
MTHRARIARADHSAAGFVPVNRRYPGLDALRLTDALPLLRGELARLKVDADKYGEAARKMEDARERVLADWRWVLAEISRRENEKLTPVRRDAP